MPHRSVQGNDQYENFPKFYAYEQPGILIISTLPKILHLKVREVIVKYDIFILCLKSTQIF